MTPTLCESWVLVSSPGFTELGEVSTTLELSYVRLIRPEKHRRMSGFRHGCSVFGMNKNASHLHESPISINWFCYYAEAVFKRAILTILFDRRYSPVLQLNPLRFYSSYAR